MQLNNDSGQKHEICDWDDTCFRVRVVRSGRSDCWFRDLLDQWREHRRKAAIQDLVRGWLVLVHCARPQRRCLILKKRLVLGARQIQRCHSSVEWHRRCEMERHDAVRPDVFQHFEAL